MTSILQTRSFALPAYTSSALSVLKWLALALMVVDHVEAFWFQRSFDSQLGRLVFPIFACVLGYNLARVQLGRPDFDAILLRLLAFAGLALREAREMFEREYLVAQINRFGGNISRTANFVGMERSALHRKLKSLNVISAGRSDRSEEAEAHV